jgi:hypothetical protein
MGCVLCETGTEFLYIHINFVLQKVNVAGVCFKEFHYV